MVLKICEWCEEPFEAKHGNEKYCLKHKSEAKKEASRKRRQKHYHQKEKRKLKLGTINIGAHISSKIPPSYLGTTTLLSVNERIDIKFYNEWQTVHNEKIGVTTSSKKGRQNNNTWVEYDGRYGQIESGSPLPHNTHQSGYNDYINISVSYWMAEARKCPECGDTLNLKDLSRAEVACGNCGLLLCGSPHRSVTYPDITESLPFMKTSREHKWKTKIDLNLDTNFS